MNEGELFQSALDAKLEDSATPFLFADWLAQRGDERCVGYRYMAVRHKHPYRSYSTWEWWDAQSSNPPEIVLPSVKWRALSEAPAPGYRRCKEFASRRAAEEALCELFVSGRRRPRRRKPKP